MKTKEQIKNEVKDCVLNIRSDVIVCVDYDSHADHRMVAAIFDDLILDLIKCNNYKPIILKKFAYLGTWIGPDDFFSVFSKETLPHFENELEENKEYENCLPYEWSDRIRVKANRRDYSLNFWKSKVFKAYCTYFTQCGFRHFFQASNADVVYWHRSTKSLLYYAKIVGSSGDVKYINDFAIAKIDSIKKSFSGVDRFDACAWIPLFCDGEKYFIASWDEPIYFSSFKLYQNFRVIGHIEKFEITLSNGFKQLFDCSVFDTDTYDIPCQRNISWMKFTIICGKGEMGIREFELYEESISEEIRKLDFLEIDSDSSNENKHIKFYQIIYRLYWFIMRFRNRINKCIGLSNWS